LADNFKVAFSQRIISIIEELIYFSQKKIRQIVAKYLRISYCLD